MKTQVITIAAIIALAFGTVNVSNAATKVNAATVLENVSKINNIEVRGNVQVFVSAGTADKIKVYNNYYGEDALVQSQNGTLRISSYTNQKLVVWVTVNDLHSINAYDNAEVKSFGKLSVIDLNVNLYNNATADLNLDSYSADVKLSDHAKANLAGNVNEFDLTYAQSATVNQANFIAEHKVIKNVKPVTKSDLDELAQIAAL
jgi:hypothetical protein